MAQVLDKFVGIDFTVEYKYDGERAQVHVMEDGRVAIYRRARMGRVACGNCCMSKCFFTLYWKDHYVIDRCARVWRVFDGKESTKPPECFSSWFDEITRCL